MKLGRDVMKTVDVGFDHRSDWNLFEEATAQVSEEVRSQVYWTVYDQVLNRCWQVRNYNEIVEE